MRVCICVYVGATTHSHVLTSAFAYHLCFNTRASIQILYFALFAYFSFWNFAIFQLLATHIHMLLAYAFIWACSRQIKIICGNPPSTIHQLIQYLPFTTILYAIVRILDSCHSISAAATTATQSCYFCSCCSTACSCTYSPYLHSYILVLANGRRLMCV